MAAAARIGFKKPRSPRANFNPDGTVPFLKANRAHRPLPEQYHVIGKRPEKVLPDGAQRPLAQRNRGDNAVQFTANKGDIAGFHGDIRAGADGDGNVRLRQRRASLMPSPTIATILPSLWRFLTSSALCSGRTSAKTRSMPACRAIASAVRLLSPVTIATSIPILCS